MTTIDNIMALAEEYASHRINWDSGNTSHTTPWLVDAAEKALRTALADALAAQQYNADPSCTTVALSEMILSDCGCSSNNTALVSRVANRIYAHMQAAQPVREHYDKTEMNAFVQELYVAKMREGKHGHYEILFHVVHKAIERAHGIGGDK